MEDEPALKEKYVTKIAQARLSQKKYT